MEFKYWNMQYIYTCEINTFGGEKATVNIEKHSGDHTKESYTDGMNMMNNETS